MERLEVLRGDITRLKVDAVVNAANETLLGGGGVDGAIHRAAGPRLLEECRKLGGCPTGECRLTRGYLLPAAWVLHTVGPLWRGGGHREDELLSACYQSCLETAAENRIRSLAFPSISTGAYGFPVERAAALAASILRGFLASHDLPEKVFMVCFDPATFESYRLAFGLK